MTLSSIDLSRKSTELGFKSSWIDNCGLMMSHCCPFQGLNKWSCHFTIPQVKHIKLNTICSKCEFSSAGLSKGNQNMSGSSFWKVLALKTLDQCARLAMETLFWIIWKFCFTRTSHQQCHDNTIWSKHQQFSPLNTENLIFLSFSSMLFHQISSVWCSVWKPTLPHLCQSVIMMTAS